MERQSRRQFCAQTCRAASVAALGGAIATAIQACGGGGSSPTSPGGSFSPLPTVAGTVASNAITVNVDASSPLAGVGSMALVRSTIGDALVVRTSQDAFSAFSSICTHQGNEVTGFSGQVFVCPAHGAQFDTGGRVVAGPARTALRQYSAQFVNGVLTISA
jgi:cytochrome b6-f complex iron-sulfur subunit